jgi:sugar-specific transcriptional regulator TrmB
MGTVARVSDSPEAIAERLTGLGFSQYEARTYVGLLMSDGTTGYSLANQTGVPQPKVYETLRRLVKRGAAVQTGKRPARYAPVPPSVLLASLEAEFRDRLALARDSLKKLPPQKASGQPAPLLRLEGFDAAAGRAAEAIREARSRVYLSGHAEALRALAEAVEVGASRGVEFIIIHFGTLPFPAPPGHLVRHASTEGALYSSRKSRHLGLVVDSHWALWALARDGTHWEAVCGDLPLLAGLLKSYIRHDLFVQRIYADAPVELESRYGPGLLRLNDLSVESEEVEEDVLPGAG